MDEKHRAEINAAIAIASDFGVEHRIFNLPIHQFGGSALTTEDIPISDYDPLNQSIPNTYVPARNTIFLSIALALAEVISAKDIFIGVSHIDYSGYPDCRPEYIKAFQDLANLATRSGIEEGGIQIHTPLIHLSKAQTILLGQQLGVNYDMTVSCYRADENGRGCGTCDSCVLRQKGFAESLTKTYEKLI